MERIIEFSPAFDKRHPDPSKNYGVQGVEIRFVLKGELGAVQFLLFTNWMLPHVQVEHDKRFLSEPDQLSIDCLYHPMPADLGYHSFTPTYEGQIPISDSCEYLNGKPCYYDGSGLAAERVYQRLLREGSDGVWTELEDYYESTFDAHRKEKGD